MFKMIKKNLKSIYRRFVYFLFRILYNPINGVLIPNNNTEIYQEEILIYNSKYKIFTCRQCVLYTDTIHDTAILKNDKIIEGPSFQYRDNINKPASYNSVFEKGTPRFRKRIDESIYSFLIGGGGNTNYWHWLFDVLPKFYIFKQSKFFNFNNLFLFPNLEKKFQKETLDILGIKKSKRLSSKKYRHIKAKEIIIADHPYNFLNDPSKDSLDIPIWIFDFLRKSFLSNYNFKKKLPKKIFISRKDGNSLRYITNETELKNFLFSIGYEEIVLSEKNFTEQVLLFNNAEIIIGLHGAGFANIVFCEPKTKIIELRPNSAGEIIKNLALKNNLDYKSIVTFSKTIESNNQSGDIEIDLNVLSKILNK